MIIFSWVKEVFHRKTKWQVIGMHKMKMSNRQIGRHLNISEFIVRTTIKYYLSTGSVNDKPRTGRPKKLSARDEKIHYTLSRRNPKAIVSALSAKSIVRF